MFSAFFSFLGGSVFRMIWGEVSSFVSKRQDHAHEIEMLRLQRELDDAAHQRKLEHIRMSHELNIRQIEVQSDADEARGAADAFTEAMRNAFKPTGFRLVDVWNGVVRPSFATLCLALWTAKVAGQGFYMDEWDTSLLAGIVGFYFADRSLGKRGK
jgi:hypothetical protein